MLFQGETHIKTGQARKIDKDLKVRPKGKIGPSTQVLFSRLCVTSCCCRIAQFKSFKRNILMQRAFKL